MNKLNKVISTRRLNNMHIMEKRRKPPVKQKKNAFSKEGIMLLATYTSVITTSLAAVLLFIYIRHKI